MLVLGGGALANKRIQKKRETEQRKKRLQKKIVDTYGYNENKLKNKSLKLLSSIAEKEQLKQEKQREELTSNLLLQH